MALDAIQCYIYNVKSIEHELFKNDFKKWRYIRKNNSHLSYYDNHVNGIYLKYQPLLNQGKLGIKFNVAKLIIGDNISSIFCCNVQQLFERLCEELNELIDLKEAPHIRYWKVSHFENNINIIRDKDIIEAIYNTICKIKQTTNYNMHCIYNDKGTIYFGNGRDKESSTIIIKFYFKLKQIIDTKSDINIKEYHHNNDIIKLNSKESILRIEITTYRRKITDKFKPKVLYSSDVKHESYGKNKRLTKEQSIGTFEDVFNYDYQTRCLKEVIKEFHLDKIITTKSRLLEFIKNSSELSDKEKNTAIRVIYTLNLGKNYHKKKPSEVSINKYKNWILNHGYHYIYADKEVQPILLEKIIEELPQKQQQAIKLYKNSNIYYDMWKR